MTAHARRAGSAAICVALLAAAVGCGSSSDKSSSGGGSTAPSTASSDASSTASNDCVTQAKAGLEPARQPAKFVVPTGSVQMASNKGKTIWYISLTQSIPFIANISNAVKEAGSAAGMKVVVFDGKGDVGTWNQGVDQAVAQGADGIILQGIDPTLVKNGLAKAEAKHIPVIDSFNQNPDEVAPGIAAHVTTDFTRDGKVMADYVLSQTNCDANAIVFTQSIFHLLVNMNDGIKGEFKRLCPDCKLKFVEVDPAKMTTTLGPQTQVALRRDPKINFIMSAYDGMASLQVPALEGIGSKVPIISHDGTEQNLEYVRDGKLQVADLSFPPADYTGWAQVDQIGRAMTGEKPEGISVPVQLFDKENVPSDVKQAFPAFGDFRSAFKQVWGLNGQ
jgi:ABC-type sugar transport system substrate-binding protein